MKGLAMTEHLFARTLLTCLLTTAHASVAAPSVVLDEELEIQTIEAGVFLVVHRFPGACNSLIVQCSKRAFTWVDTPCSNEATEKVHQWLTRTHDDANVVQINTGFHNDNLAGNGYLIGKGIPCYGSDLTPRLITECWDQTVQKVLPYYERHENRKYRDALLAQKLVAPNKVYPLAQGLSFGIGQESVEVHFPGPSHTRDNVVVYFKNRGILYGGCMIKARNARNLGFLGDADVAAWPKSARKVLKRYPDARIVVPGHGTWGDLELVRHTIELGENRQATR
jgi:glyoxylase-like metal-dependent hydrolase (beta-lactamase superfamily II)